MSYRIGLALALCSLALSRPPAAPPPATGPTPAQAAFARLKALSGTWQATSTKGWTEAMTYQTIAAESAVVETSIGAHPDETMTTVFHMDGDRLLLTHYCVAKNQPRLVATGFSDAGRTVTFAFLDATNLPSHDTGHMDKVVYKFADDDHFTTQWTWFEHGREQWMEEVAAVRTGRSTR